MDPSAVDVGAAGLSRSEVAARIEDGRVNVVPEPPATYTPREPLPKSTVPLALVPSKLPAMMWLSE